MAVEKVLRKILSKGIENKYFEIEKIGKIEDSCCKFSNIKAIDFDKTKKSTKRKGDKEKTSCDALVVSSSKKRLYFIEMKSLINFKTYKDTKSNNIGIEDKIISFIKR